MSENGDILSFVTVENRDASRDASADGREFTGVLLHGFGASAQDLVPLGPALGAAARWIVPHAPVPITVAGMSYGRAWFPRESDALEQAVFGSYFQDLRRIEPPGLQIAADAVRRLIDTQEVSWDDLIIGGFSQGAMVAAEILRQGAVDGDRPLPAAVVLFSGALIAARWWDGVHTSRAQDGAGVSKPRQDRPNPAGCQRVGACRPSHRGGIPG